MKQIIIFLLLAITLILVFVYCEDKPNNPPPREDPGYYYPRQKDYSWRYVHEGQGVMHDTFDLTIVGTNVRDGNPGYDRLRVGTEDTIFIYEKANALFTKNVRSGVLFKILVGPIRKGTSWSDGYFDYEIQGLVACTLTIHDELYKRCAKIIKRNRNQTKLNIVYEWWAPEVGEVKEIEVDPSGVRQYTKELLDFTTTGQFP